MPLPLGQALTRKFPVVGKLDASPVPSLEDWRLLVEGLIEPSFELTRAELLAISQKELEADIHCVTGWSQLGMRFTGIPLTDLLAARGAEVHGDARFIRFVAYSGRNHDTSLPLERALADTWLVHCSTAST